ncbi:MAG TPA: HdeA/HdeB family chaperone, partial [Myxococcota bacterium]|nr:HdeA/HdeB family chaperone [Myxococcota bacterium]
SLDSEIQPEVAYWLAGYNAAAKTDVATAGEVDLETDTAVLIQECKPAPKASLWEKIKKKF